MICSSFSYRWSCNQCRVWGQWGYMVVPVEFLLLQAGMQVEEMVGDEYEFIRNLGEGAFGKVELYRRARMKPTTFILDILKAKYRKTPITSTEYVALKKFNFNNLEESNRNGLDYPSLRELKYLISMEHPNIIKGKGAILSRKETKPAVYLILDFMLELHEVLVKLPDIFSNQINLKTIAFHTLFGLDFLHKNMILHRDLKPENIFVSREGVVKIADFGFAREFGTPNKKLSTNICTIEYRAPQIFFGSQYYTQKSDIWSFGCIVAYLFIRKTLFPSESGSEIQTLKKIFFLCGTPNEQTWPDFSKFPNFMRFEPSIKRKKITAEYTSIPPEAASIIEQCLQLDPRRRPSSQELLSQPFFQGLQNLSLNVQEFYDGKLNALVTGHK